MNVTREVILDLFPVYLSDEASPATRVLVQEFLAQDPDLAQSLKMQCAENFATAVPASLPPELELRSLRRTRWLMWLQAWLVGFGYFFALVPLSFAVSWKDGHLEDAHFLFRDYPGLMGTSLVIAGACFVGYWLISRRLRTS
jgi:hypothetical protein